MYTYKIGVLVAATVLLLAVFAWQAAPLPTSAQTEATPPAPVDYPVALCPPSATPILPLPAFAPLATPT